VRADGAPSAGLVTLTPVATRDSAALNLTVVAAPVVVTLDGAGKFARTVVAGNDPGLGAISYLQVDERIDGESRTYTILVPESASATGLDLADSEFLEPVPAMAGYVLLSSIGVTVAPLVDNLVPAVHLPPASSGIVGQIQLIANAAVALSGHRVVTSRPDGTLEYASNAIVAHLHAPLWLTQGAVSTGQPATVLAYGTLIESSWAWIPGAPLFLGSNGLLTQTPPIAPAALFSAQVGIATRTTAAFFDRQPSIGLV